MEPFGFLIVDKPQGMTSHDVVNVVRRGIGIKRIGHAGTLDPMATGVLILCIGLATRLSEYVMSERKSYTATIRLGIETDTYDADGETVAVAETSHLSAPDIERALLRFQGDVEQVPPMYSAIKQGGKKLYKLARQGKEVERAPRNVWMATHLLDLNLPTLSISITCSAGTYIRSIAHDLGALLGVGAHLTALRRTASTVTVDEAVPWLTLIDGMNAGNWQRYLVSETRLMAHIAVLKLNEAHTQDMLHGRFIPSAQLAIESPYEGDLRRGYDPAGRFIGIMGLYGDHWKPIKIFNPESSALTE